MKAMILKRFGETGNFAVENIPVPEPDENEVLVRIRATDINPIDIKTRKGGGMAGAVSRENPMILGWDLSGTVVRTGGGTAGFKPGDEIFGTVNFPGPGSTYAEFAAVSAGQIALKPENTSHAEAAAATLSALTAWQALADNGHIRKGQRILIHGAAGGVGSYAVQIAKHFGCYVIATASGNDRSFVESQGADEVVDYKTQNFEDIAGKADFILDTVGGGNFVRSLNVLAPEGMIVLLPSDKKAEADRIAQERGIKNYRHMLVHSDGNGMRQIAAMLEQGSLKVHIDRTYTFDEIPQAHERLENGNVRGKIVIVL